MESTFAQYRSVYEMLEDEESKDIYLHRLNYLVSNDNRYVQEIVTAYLPDMIPAGNQTLSDLFAALPQERKYVCYGVGAMGKELRSYWENDERFLGFCSHTKKKQEEGYLGYPCISPEELLRRRDLAVVISAKWDHDEILKVLQDGDYPVDLIFQTKGFSLTDSPGQYFDPGFMTP